MERIKDLLKVDTGDFIYKSGNLSIVQSIEIIDRKVQFNMDDGSVIVEKLVDSPSKLEVFSGNPGEIDHPKPEQTDHLKSWRKLSNFTGEDFQFSADLV